MTEITLFTCPAQRRGSAFQASESAPELAAVAASTLDYSPSEMWAP